MSNNYESQWFYRQQVQLGSSHHHHQQQQQQQQPMNRSAGTISSHHSFVRPATRHSSNVIPAEESLATKNRRGENAVLRDITLTALSDSRFQELESRNYCSPEQHCVQAYAHPYYNSAPLPSSMYIPPTPFTTFDSPATGQSCTYPLPNACHQPPWFGYSSVPARSWFDPSSRQGLTIPTTSASRCFDGDSALCTRPTDNVCSSRFSSKTECDILDKPISGERRLVAARNHRYRAHDSINSIAAASPVGFDISTKSSLSPPLLPSRVTQWPPCVIPNHSIASICSSSGDRDAIVSSAAAASGPWLLEGDVRNDAYGTSRTARDVRESTWIIDHAAVSKFTSDVNCSNESKQPLRAETYGADDVDTVPTRVDIDALLQAVHSTAHRCSVSTSTARFCGVPSRDHTSNRRERAGRQLHDPKAVKALRAWYDANQLNTVADRRTLEQLANITGMTPVQVRKWLYNMRYRSGQTKKHKLQ